MLSEGQKTRIRELWDIGYTQARIAGKMRLDRKVIAYELRERVPAVRIERRAEDAPVSGYETSAAIMARIRNGGGVSARRPGKVPREWF